MKTRDLLPLAFLVLSSLKVHAAPSHSLNPGLEVVDIGQTVSSQNPFNVEFRSEALQRLDEAKQVILRGKKNLERWVYKERHYIKQDDLLYEFISHLDFIGYDLRVTEPQLCDPSVKQYSGYLDIANDKHLFFWFFEARNSPSKAPLILWLNGGPGCSSSTGLLAELGPCRVANEGRNTTFNPYSWNTHANVIFLDQPVNVGYSYADHGTTVSTSPVAGKDVYAFLQMFLHRFPKYAKAPFHIAAESYGGMYAPNIANIIFKRNKELATTRHSNLIHINLASIVLGNGLTDPYIQTASIPDYVCDGPYLIYPPGHPQCAALRSKMPTCQRLIKMCYNTNSRAACLAATVYCETQIMGPLMQTGLNPYDVRLKCDPSEDVDGPFCYRQVRWIDTWMNNPDHKVALGVNPDRTFQACNMDVNKAFTMKGDSMHNSAALLPELVDGGVRLLVYAGNADMMCNYMGNERWVDQLPTRFLAEFNNAKPIPWVTTYNGEVAGEARSAGGHGLTAGNITFVNVFESGHMVPYDQPEAAFDLITRWISDIPLSITEDSLGTSRNAG